MNKFSLYTDGGARGNPGPAAIGIVLYDATDVVKQIGEVIGETTNNQAEYKALIRGLEEAIKLNAEELVCHLDSELLVRQMQGKYKIREENLKPLASEVLKLTSKLKKVEFIHVPREKNKLADKLVNQALDGEV